MDANVTVLSGVYNNISVSINIGNKFIGTKDWTNIPIIDNYRVEPCKNYPYVKLVDTIKRYRFIPDLTKSKVCIVLSTILPNDTLIDHQYTICINGVTGAYPSFITDTNSMIVKINNNHEISVLIADESLEYDKIFKVRDDIGVTGVVARDSYIDVKYDVKFQG